MSPARLTLRALALALAGLWLAHPSPSHARPPAEEPARPPAPPPAITFHVDPPDAVVSDQFGDLGGVSRPVRLRPSTSYGNGDVRLTFRAQGYRTFTQSVSAAYFTTSTTYPPDGEISLAPATPLAFVRVHRWSLATATVVLITAGTALAIARRRLREARDLEARVITPARADSNEARRGTIGPYLIVDRLGAGAMATVYRAVPSMKPDDPPVALKVVNEVMRSTPDFVGRFKREVDLYRRLSHPNIVRLIDWGEQEGLVYVALEVMDGGTLREKMSASGVLPAVAIQLLSPLYRAVHYAHTQGVVHRDLKPENIMLTQGGVVKVTDFGLGRAPDSGQLTRSDVMLGTPSYMSPEQVVAAQVDPSMDQYALGVITFEMICGQLPFRSADALQMAMMHVQEDPPTPSEVRRDVPPAVDKAILTMLAKSAHDRYPSVDEAERALSRALRAWMGHRA